MYFFVTLTFSLSGRDVEMPKFLNKTIGPLAVTCRTNLAQHFYCVLQFPHYLRLFFCLLELDNYQAITFFGQNNLDYVSESKP